jgi:hypothetical protein
VPSLHPIGGAIVCLSALFPVILVRHKLTSNADLVVAAVYSQLNIVSQHSRHHDRDPDCRRKHHQHQASDINNKTAGNDYVD